MGEGGGEGGEEDDRLYWMSRGPMLTGQRGVGDGRTATLHDHLHNREVGQVSHELLQPDHMT